jgi:hypothetical protein
MRLSDNLVIQSPCDLNSEYQKWSYEYPTYSSLKNKFSTKCLRFATNNAAVSIATCDKSQFSYFHLLPIESGLTKIKASVSDQILGITGGSLANDVESNIWNDQNVTNQKWNIIQSLQSGYFTIKNKNSNKCLQHNNGKVTQTTCSEVDIKLWQLTQQTFAPPTITTANFVKLGVLVDSTAFCIQYLSDNSVKMYYSPCTDTTTNVNWKFISSDFLSYIIQSEANSNQYLGIFGANLNDSAKANTWADSTSESQKFYVEYIDSTTFKLRNRLTKKCITYDPYNHNGSEIDDNNYIRYVVQEPCDSTNPDFKQEFKIYS